MLLVMYLTFSVLENFSNFVLFLFVMYLSCGLFTQVKFWREMDSENKNSRTPKSSNLNKIMNSSIFSCNEKIMTKRNEKQCAHLCCSKKSNEFQLFCSIASSTVNKKR